MITSTPSRPGVCTYNSTTYMRVYHKRKRKKRGRNQFLSGEKTKEKSKKKKKIIIIKIDSTQMNIIARVRREKKNTSE